MRSKFLAFFRENPVLLLVPTVLAFFYLFWDSNERWDSKERVELGSDPETWFEDQSEIALRFDSAQIRLHSNGNWELDIPPVMGSNWRMPYIIEMPERGGGTWRVRGSDLILGEQSNELGHPIDLSGSRLSDPGDHLQLILLNGTTRLLTPMRD